MSPPAADVSRLRTYRFSGTRDERLGVASLPSLALGMTELPAANGVLRPSYGPQVIHHHGDREK